MKAWGILAAGIALVVVGLIGLLLIASAWWGWRGRPDATEPMMRGWRGFQRPSEFRSNGERIYYTATSDSGDPITFTGGPHWLYMHGGSCVDCHGPRGTGGIGVPMTNQIAPDIRYATLTTEEHGEEHPPYTDSLLRRAITEGLDPAGQPLHWAMPRWHMSDQDLNDLIGHLKTLGSEQ